MTWPQPSNSTEITYLHALDDNYDHKRGFTIDSDQTSTKSLCLETIESERTKIRIILYKDTIDSPSNKRLKLNFIWITTLINHFILFDVTFNRVIWLKFVKSSSLQHFNILNDTQTRIWNWFWPDLNQVTLSKCHRIWTKLEFV